MSATGEVYFLPPLEGEGGRLEGKGDRPFILLGTSMADGVATLAYCSTRATETGYGAASVWIDPALPEHTGCGFSRPSYVYPSRLGSYTIAALGRPSGRIRTALPAIRRELARALGLGTGVCTDIDLPRGSRRGSIIALTSHFATLSGYAHAVVVTEPVYSRERRQQTIVPILSLQGFEQSPRDVVVRNESWIPDAMPGEHAVILAPALITTVFEPDFLDAYTGSTVDAATMERIEEGLRTHFDLGAHLHAE